MALVGTGLALLAFAPSAGAVSKEFYGIDIAGPLSLKDLNRMEASNVGTVRFLLSWPAIQPKKGVHNWPDAKIQQLAEHGIRPIPYVEGSPKWATHSSNNRKPPLKGKAKRAWKTFLKKVVKRYKPDGTFWKDHPNVPAKPIKQWQVWNEPNLKKEWGGRPSPKKYGKLLTISDKVIHKADRHAKVVLAGLSGGKTHGRAKYSTYLKKLYGVKKIKKHFDAAAFHPYAPQISELKNRIKTFRKTMRKGHDNKTALWITEIGYGSGPKDRFRLNKGSLKGQATALKKSFKVIKSHKKPWKVKRLQWYDWRDPATPVKTPGCSFCPYAGLLKGDETPKPAYNEFRAFTLAGH